MLKQLLHEPAGPNTPGGPDHIVYQNEQFVAFVPWSPPSEYCIWILPIQHTHDLFLDPQLHATDQARSAVLAALADALRQVCRRLYWLCGNPDYNIIVRSNPLKHDKQLAASYHWHLEVSPRFTKAGGLELATQNSFSVLLTDPADAARKPRAAVMPEGGKRRGSCLAYVE